MGVFQAVAGTLENGVTAYVNTTASVLAAALVPVASAGLSIWAVLYGVAVVRGEVHEPLWGFTWKLFKTAFILSIALGQGVYQTHIVTMIYSVADGLVTTMAGGAAAACMVGGKGQQVYATLDCTWNQFMEVGMAYYRDGARVGFFSAPDVAIARLISAILVWLSGTLFTVVMAAEIVVARFMMGLALVFGPICIASLAFEPSKKYFDGWASFIWFCVVMQAVCVAFLGLGMVAIGAVMNPFGVPSAVADPNSWAAFEKAIQDSGNAWSAILAIVTLFCLLFYIGAFRLSGLASAITGGGSHSSLTGAAAAFVAGQVLRGVGGGSGSGQQGGQIANAGPPSKPSGNTMQTGGSIGPTASQQAAKEGRSSFNASYSGYSSSDTASASSQDTNYNTSTTGESYRSDLHRASHKTGENVGRSVGRAAEMMRKRMKP